MITKDGEKIYFVKDLSKPKSYSHNCKKLGIEVKYMSAVIKTGGPNKRVYFTEDEFKKIEKASKIDLRGKQRKKIYLCKYCGEDNIEKFSKINRSKCVPCVNKDRNMKRKNQNFTPKMFSCKEDVVEAFNNYWSKELYYD